MRSNTRPKLTVVPSTPPEEGLGRFTPLFLDTPDLLDTYWPQAEVLLRPVVEKAMHGEMTVIDIYNRIRAGQMRCLIARNDDAELPEVGFVMVFELVLYPRMAAIHIVALGGHRMKEMFMRNWHHVCSWAHLSGTKTIQALVSPAMARMIGPLGFKPVYSLMRYSLTETGHGH